MHKTKLKKIVEQIQNDPQLIKAEKCRRDFYYFVKEFWSSIIEEDFVTNWHIPYLCKQLEEAAWRVIARLPKAHDIIINIPPGTTKSTIAAQMYVAWVWIARLPKDRFDHIYKARAESLNQKVTETQITGADSRFITGSYSNALSLEHAEYTRDIVRSDKYRAYFPEIEIRRDKDLKSNYKTNKGGSRFSTSVGATVTGVHGHFIIVDDPLNPNQAISDVERENANQWMGKTLSTRKVNKKVTVTIIIMQRLHKEDVSGKLIDNKDKKVKHIRLPGEDSYEIKPPALAKYYINGLLDPKRLPQDVLNEMRVDLGAYGYAGQVGQDPRPREGGMFNRAWFEVVDSAPAGGTQSVRGWDLAATSEAEAKKKHSKPAYTAGAKMKYRNGVFYIEHITRFRASPGIVRRRMKNTASQDGKDTIIDYPQDPGQAGKAQARDLAKHLVGYNVKYSLESGDKVLRADPFSAQCEAGNVKIVRGDWNEAFLDEADYFPNGFKDQIDCLVRAFNRLLVLNQQDCGIVGGPSGFKNERQLNPDKAA